jgi:hypothetical protein
MGNLRRALFALVGAAMYASPAYGPVRATDLLKHVTQ